MKRKKNLHTGIIKQCAKGNSRAQFQFYQMYYKTMYNTAYKILHNSADAEEAMQEGFLNAFVHMHEIKTEKQNIEAWLRRIVINKSIDYLRKKKQVSFSELNEETLMVENTTNDDHLNDEHLSVDQIKACIQDLPQGYKLVLTLYLLEGYDHDEISEILNISASTSRSQFARAKQVLIKNLKTKSYA
jgi:RNA polymerase sigma factor (sigma-70 family)